MAASTIPSWVVWVPVVGTVCGAMIGGAIGFFASARSTRAAIASRFKEQWISEFRSAVTEMMTEINAFASKVKKSGFDPEEATKVFAQINKVVLFLDQPGNCLHLVFIKQVNDVMSTLKSPTQSRFSEEFGFLAVLFREIIHEEMVEVSNHIAYPWQQRRKRNPAIDEKLKALAEQMGN